jgi:amino acid transporter
MIFVFSHKAKWHKPITPASVHSWIGVFCGLLILIQVFSGFEKIENLEQLNNKSRRWHGDLGLLLWDMLIAAILTGMLQFLTLASLLSIVSMLAVVVVWVMVHSQLKRRLDEYKTDSDTEGASFASSPDRNAGPVVEDGVLVHSGSIAGGSTHTSGADKSSSD